MAMSVDLTGLAARVKEAEDHATAARAKTKAEVEQDMATVRASAEARADKLRQDAEDRKSKLSVWWHDLERSWNQHLAKIRDDVEAKRAEHERTGPSGAPRGPKATPSSRSPSHMPQWRKRSTRCSTRRSRGWKPTN